MSYSLNSLKGGSIGDYLGEYYGEIKGHTRNLDCGSYQDAQALGFLWFMLWGLSSGYLFC